MRFLRSIAVQFLFYLVFSICAVLFLPTLALPRRLFWKGLQWWSWIIRQTIRVGGIRMEFRGVEHLPKTGCIIALKHQSALETIMMLDLFHDPAFILKRELMWLPLFGWYAQKGRMLPINRDRRGEALKDLAIQVREAVRIGRSIIIFPEGTRRPVGIEPSYKFGISRLYRESQVPVVPVALNTGLFWPRNTIWRHPGTAIIEFLPPIPAGLEVSEFQKRLVSTIESASDRLFLEAVDQPDHPPLTPLASAYRDRLRANITET